MSNLFKNRTITLVAAFVLTATSLVGLSATSSGTVAQANGGTEDPPFTTIAVGDTHACGITPSDYENPNAIYCWGTNDEGQLGVAASVSSVLEGPLDESTWDSISLGRKHSCGIKSDGSMWCWGENDFGQLGSEGDATEIPREVAGEKFWTMVSAGDDNTCGIDDNADIYCWGNNENSQLADFGPGSEYNTPYLIDSTLTWRKVAVSATHACAIDSGYQLWCWGDNGNLQLGNREESVLTSPSLAFETTETYATWLWNEVEVASGVTCATRRFGSQGLYCWGTNTAWRAGADGEVYDDNIPTRIMFSASNSKFDVSATHGCKVFSANSFCWGADSFGQTSARSMEPEDHDMFYEPFLYLYAGYRQLEVGVDYSCGVKVDDSWWCWGNDTNDQLGLRPILPRQTLSLEFVDLPGSLSVLSDAFEVEVVVEPEVAYEVWGGRECTSYTLEDGRTLIAPSGRVGECEINAWVQKTEEFIENGIIATIPVRAALMRSKKVFFYAVKSDGYTVPIVGARVTWQQGAFSGAVPVTTGRDGSALFPTLAGGTVDFTFASGGFTGFKILPGKVMQGTVGSAGTDSLYFDLQTYAPRIRLIPPEGQTGGTFSMTMPAMTCEFERLLALGCTGRSTTIRNSGGVATTPGWCVEGGYVNNCWGMLEVPASYTYQGVVQSYTRTWGYCLDGSADCTDDDGTWNFEMDTFPFVEVEPTMAPVWFGEIARVAVRALGSGRVGLMDYDVVIRPVGGAVAAPGCVPTTQSSTDASGNAYLEVCPSRTGKWVVEGGALLPSSEMLVTVIRTPSAPQGLAVDIVAGSATLTWDAPEHLGATAISAYRVNYRVAGSSAWRTVRARGSSSLEAAVAGLKTGVTYEFRVMAANRDGSGLWSEIFTATAR